MRRGEALHLRPLERLCTVGQTEPLLDVCPPSKREHTAKRKRCMQQMALEVRRRCRQRGEEPPSAGSGDPAVKAAQQWWPAREAYAVRYECRDCWAAAEEPAASMEPEDVCILEAVERGVRRLHALGITSLTGYDRGLRKAGALVPSRGVCGTSGLL